MGAAPLRACAGWDGVGVSARERTLCVCVCRGVPESVHMCVVWVRVHAGPRVCGSACTCGCVHAC